MYFIGNRGNFGSGIHLAFSNSLALYNSTFSSNSVIKQANMDCFIRNPLYVVVSIMSSIDNTARWGGGVHLDFDNSINLNRCIISSKFVI